jgi:putative glutamine amidotransferase
VPAARPLIGLTTSEMREPVRDELLPHAEAGREEMILGFHYLRAVAAAGGLPTVMAPLPDKVAPDIVEHFDGVLVPGGPDIDPSAYGREPHPGLGPTWPELDRFEIAVVRAAEERGIPVLAICRGAQVLNVAHGGTLYQHLPEEPGTNLKHRRGNLGDPIVVHEVRVEPGTKLAGALGVERLEVNSYHHQAPWEIGRGLRPVAWAPDGIVEGLETEADDFVVGVQWHPEAIQDRPEQAALFRAFVDAASRRSSPRPERRPRFDRPG